MNDRQLRYAHAVWRERSFSKAGEKLGVSQPSLSDQIRLLEKELGFDLFIRTSRGVDASPNGVIFLNEVDLFVGRMADLKSLAHELHGKPGTRVRIGIGYGLVGALTPLIAQALCQSNRRVFPDITTGTTRRIQRLLGQQRLDIGIIFQNSVATPRQTLALETVAEDEIVVLMREDDPLAQGQTPVPLAVLARRRSVLSEPRLGYGRAVLAHLEAAGLTLETAAYCDDADALKFIVAAGGAVALLPRLATADATRQHGLVALGLEPALTIAVQIARRPERQAERLEKPLGELQAAIKTLFSNG